MRFLHGKVKAHSGEKIIVDISEPTRVLVMKEREFNKYRNNMTFTYFGGQKDAQYEFTVPGSGNWIVVIEKGTYYDPKEVTASIRKEAPERPVVLEPAPSPTVDEMLDDESEDKDTESEALVEDEDDDEKEA